MRQTIKDLTFSEHSEWFGLGPLVLAVGAGVRAVMVDDPFARWAWGAVAVLMLILCAAYAVWTRKRRSADGPQAPRRQNPVSR